MGIKINYLLLRYTTPQGGNIKIVDSHKESGKTKITLHCSICSKDSELFPRGSLVTYKGSLDKGRFPCRCGRPNWSKEQAEVLVKRKASEVGVIFLGCVGTYCGTYTKISLRCEKHDVVWHTTTVSNFLNKRRKNSSHCPSCRKDKRVKTKSISDKDWVQRFREAGFGSQWSFSGRKEKPVWRVVCSHCQKDEIAQAGLCNGEFYSSSCNLLKGKVPCRCNPFHKLPTEIQEYYIQPVLKRKGYVFQRLFRDGKGTLRVSYICPLHGERSAPYISTLNGSSCKECHNSYTLRGAYKNFLDRPDNIYIMSFKSDCESFVKIGRAFNPYKRSKDFPKNYRVTLLETLGGSHEEVFEIELRFHKVMRRYRHNPAHSFGGETECYNKDYAMVYLEKLKDIQRVIHLENGIPVRFE